MSARLDSLLHHPALWRADAQVRARRPAISSGCAGLDALLPDGGWSPGSLIEVLHDGAGIGELRLFVPALRQLSLPVEDFRPVLSWVDPPHLPYAPALSAWGLEPAQQLIVKTARASQGLWAMEQSLRSRACGAVLGWADKVEMRWLRRLKLAAVEGGGLGILFRPLCYRAQPSPATVRIALAVEGNELQLQLLKIQGGRPGIIRWR